MIPKNAYVIHGIDKHGNGEMHYPRFFEENLTGRLYLEIQGKRPEDPYMYDYKDVEEYIRKYMVEKFCKCLISKVVDFVSVEISSSYKENK